MNMDKIRGISTPNLINRFRGRRILVVGDIMLDRFWIGESGRLSPEAPVPVVNINQEFISLGGAANVAANIKDLGASPILVGVIGNDIPGKKILEILKNKKFSYEGIFKTTKRPTTEKIRIIASGQQVARADREMNGHIDREIEAKIINFISKKIKSCECVVVSDYAKGVITNRMAKGIIDMGKKETKPIIVDAKPGNFRYFRGATIVVPNQKEAFEMSGLADIKKSAVFIAKKLRCRVLITRGQNGMTLFDKGKITHIPVKPRGVYDVSGAGDTVAAVLALSLVCGGSFSESAMLANKAAGIVVAKPGTATLTLEELIQEI